MGKLFGTDGVRGIAGEELTTDLAYRLGRAAAAVLMDTAGKAPTVLIGQDTRLSGDMLASAIAGGLSEMGCKPIRLGVVPTPAVAYLVRRLEAAAGVMISASHNPWQYNGIKIFDANGYKLPDATEERIEQLLTEEASLSPAKCEALCVPMPAASDAIAHYCDHVQSLLPKAQATHPRRILFDLANGSATATAKAIFTKEALLGDLADFSADTPNGRNINENCGSTKLSALSQAVTAGGYDIGIAFDGDADRCLAVDEMGNEINGDHIIARLALSMKREGRLAENTVVLTQLSNLGFHQMAKREGITVKITDVGDRYVLEEMLRGGYLLGGEQSGHIILTECATTGDGQLTAAKILSLLREAPTLPASRIFACMQSLPQVAINVEVPNQEKARIMKDPDVQSAVDAVRTALGDSGRILLRPSGTEQMIRIMLEGEQEETLQKMGQSIAASITEKLCGQNKTGKTMNSSTPQTENGWSAGESIS